VPLWSKENKTSEIDAIAESKTALIQHTEREKYKRVQAAFSAGERLSPASWGTAKDKRMMVSYMESWKMQCQPALVRSLLMVSVS
jgi:hypothetical protein